MGYVCCFKTFALPSNMSVYSFYILKSTHLEVSIGRYISCSRLGSKINWPVNGWFVGRPLVRAIKMPACSLNHTLTPTHPPSTHGFGNNLQGYRTICKDEPFSSFPTFSISFIYIFVNQFYHRFHSTFTCAWREKYNKPMPLYCIVCIKDDTIGHTLINCSQFHKR